MWNLIAFIAILLVGLLDGHMSSVIALLLIYSLGFISVQTIKEENIRQEGLKYLGILFLIYIVSAYIVSLSFSNEQFFYVSDSRKYIDNYINQNDWSWDITKFKLFETYVLLSDNNGLFNESFAYWSYLGNHYFDGSSIYYLTLFLTLFGILSSLEVYKIFNLYFDVSNASKYALIFAVFSIFHIYSVVIIRDIVIAYFYMLGIRKVLGTPKILDIILLLAIVVGTVGVRLYTGLFFCAFILLWSYKLMQDKRYKNLKYIVYPIIIIGVAFVGSSLVYSIVSEGVAGELEHYDDLYTEGGGFASRLRSLPIGIRQIAILLFAHFPLVSLSFLLEAKSFSNFYIFACVISYSIFNFVSFYGLIYYCFIKKAFLKIDFNDRLLILIMFAFVAVTLSTHFDFRRSMEAIPIFFLFYKYIAEKYFYNIMKSINRKLILVGFLMIFAYFFIG